MIKSQGLIRWIAAGSLMLCANVFAGESSEHASIHVQGKGAVAAVPDAFTINFIIEQKGATVSKLNQQLEADLKSVVNFLQSKNIEDKNIRSMQINLHPWYESTPQGSQEKGYVLSREIEVTHHDLASFDAIIDGVLSRGVKRIQQFSFVVSNEDEVYKEALIGAVKDARSRAELLAKELGVKVGGVLAVSEAAGSFSVPMKRARAFASESDASLPGQQQIEASVNVSFSIRE